MEREVEKTWSDFVDECIYESIFDKLDDRTIDYKSKKIERTKTIPCWYMGAMIGTLAKYSDGTWVYRGMLPHGKR